ncbi:DUF968 domain-containing protein [Klebsiella aerogenes]|nr:DUF968 domain-containing protein [Klebsiella aerogenes]
MRLLLNPVVVRELDQVILRPGRSLMRAFYGPVVITPASEKEAGRQPGILTEEQPLLEDPEYRFFWMSPEVLAAAETVGSMARWLERTYDCCQWETDDDDYHHSELTISHYEDSLLRVCWHHDRLLVDQPGKVAAIALSNAARFVLDSVRVYFKYPDHHVVTVSDIGCWSLVHKVSDQLPDSALRRILRLPDAEPHKSVYRESELRVNPADPRQIIAEVVSPETPVLQIRVEPDAPAQYMRRPKIPRWECQQYTDWVKTQDCCGCGKRADDPHHLIGHGFGGTGTKAGDFHVIPLCRVCHRQLHDNVADWERQHGSQLEHILRLQHRALGLGVIAMGAAK